MRLNLNKEKHEDTVKILKAMASKNRSESEKAQEAFAAFVGPAVTQVLNQVATSEAIYKTTVNYDQGEIPSVPIDLFFGNTEGLLTIWSNGVPGGLATNEIVGMDEYRFRTYKLDSAISFAKAYAAYARLDVVALGIDRLVQEILLKQEYQAWSVIMAALGESRTNGVPHVINSVAKAASLSRNFQLEDVNNLWTLIDRFRPSWVGGSSTSSVGQGLTDLFVSPETLAKVRAMAYNPQNTYAGPTSSVGTEVGSTTAVALPDNMREQIYRNAGMAEIFGVRLHKLLELGVNRTYNALFDEKYTAAGSEPTFDSTVDEVAVGFDLSVNAFVKASRTDTDTGSTFTLEPDDQFLRRQDKLGFYGSVECGYLAGDVKAVCGVIW